MTYHLDKAIKGLECCILRDPDDFPRCSVCPYESNCVNRLKMDALELLKAQEPVAPYMDYDGQDVWRCGKCGNSLMHPSYYESDEDAKNYIRYCSHCGKAVKWDE